MDAVTAPTTVVELTGPAPRSRAQRKGSAGSVAQHRATLYAILAQALSTPTEALSGALQDGVFWSVLRHALDGAPAAHRQHLDPGLAEAPPPTTTLEALLVEYTRLFGTDLICPHYEADYVAGGSFRLSHVLADVTALYAAFGVRVSDAAHERPDHIAIELDFMNYLAAKEAHAARQGQSVNARLCRRAQKLFFQRHLGRWAKAFAQAFGTAAQAEFHRKLCRVLDALILAEAHYLRVPLAEIEAKRETAPADADTSASVCGQCSGHR
jgi:DMSO reductase family type II enzyme chaperone